MDEDIAADFLIEAQDILDRLGEQLVALERQPTDSALLNAAFRGFHTIKGGAGFLRFTPMVDVCHAVEECLSAARSGQLRLSAEQFDGTQQALDLVQSMLAAVTAGQPMPAAPRELILKLQVSADAAPAAPQAAPQPTPAAKVEIKTEAPYAMPESDIDDLDFEALLDQLHGAGGAPGLAPADEPPPVVSAPASPAPKAKAKAVAAEPAHAAAAPAEPAEQTVRVDTRRLDAIVDLVGELVLARNRLKTLRMRLRDEELDRAVTGLDIATSRLQSAVMKTRMQPVGRVFARFPKLARDVARGLGKQVNLEVVGAETELDRNLVEALADPLVHLVRNAIDHGIESPEKRTATGKPAAGRVVMSAKQEGDHVAIEVSDDGAGMDADRLRAKARERNLLDAETAARLSPDECLQLIFLPGFSTKTEVTDVSGRGVGMDVVQSRIRELSGHIQIYSKPGSGSRFLIRVPLTLAILPTLLVQSSQTIYALPLARVLEVLSYPPGGPMWIDGRAVLDLRQGTLPLLYLRQWLGNGSSAAMAATHTIVVVQSGEQRFGLVVDLVRGREEVVIKPLPRLVRGLAGYAGASLIGDGRMALILDIDGLLRDGVWQRGNGEMDLADSSQLAVSR